MLNMNTPNQSNFPEPPTFEAVQTKINHLLDAILEAVQEGALHVSEYARWQAESIDFALAPNLLCHKAKRHLIASGQEAQDEDEADAARFKTEHVSNNGLFTTIPGFNVRILKSSDEGNVPPPGFSEARRNYYNQFQSLLDFPDRRDGNERVQPTWNLIVHWTVDDDYSLLKLSVALPLNFEKNEAGRLVVTCAFDEPFWRRPPQSGVIPIQHGPTPQPSSLDVSIEEEIEKTGEDSDEE